VIFGFSYQQVAMAAALFVISTLVTSVAATAFLVWIPEGHFVGRGHHLLDRVRTPVLRWTLLALKNLLGLALLVMGVVLALPGVPGQGLLTMLVGLFLLDIPGKRRLELALMRRPTILKAANKLRARFDKPPLQVDGAQAQQT
jgi:hypothetical protein